MGDARPRADRGGVRGVRDRRLRGAAVADPRAGAVRAHAAGGPPRGHGRAPPHGLRTAAGGAAPAPRAHPASRSRRGRALRRLPRDVGGAGKAPVRRGATVAAHAHGADRAACRAGPRRARLPDVRGPPMRRRGWLPAMLLLAAARPALAAPAPSPGEVLDVQHRTLAGSHGSIEADAGRLLVTENRAVATSRRIPIRFLRLRSAAAHPAAPLFYLAGGAGDRGVSEDRQALDFWSPYLAVTEVVLIHRLGVGAPGLYWRWDGPPPMRFFVDAVSA